MQTVVHQKLSAAYGAVMFLHQHSDLRPNQHELRREIKRLGDLVAEALNAAAPAVAPAPALTDAERVADEMAFESRFNASRGRSGIVYTGD